MARNCESVIHTDLHRKGGELGESNVGVEQLHLINVMLNAIHLHRLARHCVDIQASCERCVLCVGFLRFISFSQRAAEGMNSFSLTLLKHQAQED